METKSAVTDSDDFKEGEAKWQLPAPISAQGRGQPARRKPLTAIFAATMARKPRQRKLAITHGAESSITRQRIRRSL
jgi:hypothetical protein